MMIFLKLLLSSGLMFIVETVFILNESSLCYQPSKYIKPNHYDIQFISYIEENLFLHGQYNISISILNKTQNILFNNIYLERLDFYNIVLIRNLEKYHENANDTVYNSTYTVEEDIINVSFEDELLPGNYILYIKYSGLTDKVFRISDVKEKFALVAALHFHIIDNQRIMSSCWDQQYLFLEVTFNISIGCNQCTALSNMPLRNIEKYKDNMLLTHFNTTSAISLYHATIVVFSYPLHVYDTRNSYIQMWCRNEYVFHMLEFAKKVAEYITMSWNYDWIQRLNSIPKVTHVAIPNFPDNDITVFGLIFYNENNIIYDENVYPITHKIEVAQLVGHKVTQQWFYNLNNPFQSASWFHKALTILLTKETLNKIYPDNQIINLFVVQNQHTSFYFDEYSMWNSTSQVYSLLKIRQSIRAPFILRMMQHFFTKDIFWKGIRSYTNSTQFHRRNFTTFLEEVFAETITLHIGIYQYISLQTIEYWTLEEHCPLIKVVREYNHSTTEARISIQNFYNLKSDCFPVTFTSQKFSDFNRFVHYPVCKSKVLYYSNSVDEVGWMIFNIQQVGYYRVNYDDENWRRISNYLNSNDFKTIHVLNRAQIIDDAFHLMIAGQLNASIFWNITSYLYREEDYIAWYPMFKALEYMFSTFPVMKIEIRKFVGRIKTILNNVLTKIKYEEIDNIDELRICLRQEAARWACFFGEITCIKEANNKLEQHLNDSMRHRLLPWWTEWTYCRGVMINETWKSLYTIGVKRSDAKILQYLTCAEDTDVIEMCLRYKEYIHIEDNTGHIEDIQDNRLFDNSFLHIITKHGKNPIILTYILENFNKIKPKNVNIIVALIVMINNVYSANLTESILRNAANIVETNLLLVEVDKVEDEFKRHRIKENGDLIDKDYLYARIRSHVYYRKKQIKRQKQYFNSYFF